MSPRPRGSWPPGFDANGVRQAAGLLLLFPVREHTHLVLTVRSEHVRHHPRWATPEVALGHHAVGDVAARAAAHENLRAHATGAVEHPDTQAGRGTGGKNGGGETRGSPSHDQDVDVAHEPDKRTI